MKSRFLLFGMVFALLVFLYKRLIDTEEKLILTESELVKLKHKQTAAEQVYAEAYQHYQDFETENPFPDDPDKKMRIAMMDAILSANVRDELGDNYIDDEEELS